MLPWPAWGGSSLKACQRIVSDAGLWLVVIEVLVGIGIVVERGGEVDGRLPLGSHPCLIPTIPGPSCIGDPRSMIL